MNYKEAYEFGVVNLAEAKIGEANLDARLLLEFVCGTNRNDLYVHGDMEIGHDEFERYLFLIKERQKHVPLQHLTGEQDFMGMTFKVNEHVLIPRQDTEVLVEEVLLHLHDGMKILDMCTGSGCILLSLLKYSNDCQGLGVDVSKDALAVAKHNREQLGMDATFIHSNLFENVEGKFDIIVSNPPYIESEVVKTLMEEVKDYEPHLALDGGADGLDFYREIIAAAKKYLCRGGMLFFEIGYNQGQAVSDLLKEAGYLEVEVKKDLAGLDRVVYGIFVEEKHV